MAYRLLFIFRVGPFAALDGHHDLAIEAFAVIGAVFALAVQLVRMYGKHVVGIHQNNIGIKAGHQAALMLIQAKHLSGAGAHQKA